MNKSTLSATIVVACAMGALAGCSPHDEYPKTPAIIATTPTYRSSVRSTDSVIEPFYVTPGVNGGDPARAPSRPAPDRYSANNPLAISVYVSLLHTQSLDVQYIDVEGKGNSVWLQGTVASSAEKAKIAEVAFNTPGVKHVKDDIVVRVAS